jgi:hypothetical protein
MLAEGLEMPDLDALGFSDEPTNIPHDFEVDLNTLVVVDHKLTLLRIAYYSDGSPVAPASRRPRKTPPRRWRYTA